MPTACRLSIGFSHLTPSHFRRRNKTHGRRLVQYIQYIHQSRFEPQSSGTRVTIKKQNVSGRFYVEKKKLNFESRVIHRSRVFHAPQEGGWPVSPLEEARAKNIILLYPHHSGPRYYSHLCG